MKISIIAAIGQKRELGKGNRLLWHIPEDLAYFRKITKGHVVIMGRKTYESIGRPLPDRENIVVTHKQDAVFSGCQTVHSLQEALQRARDGGESEAFVIGGAQLYDQAIHLADRLYLTLVHGHDELADVYFPAYESMFSVVSSREGVSQMPAVTFVILDRKLG